MFSNIAIKNNKLFHHVNYNSKAKYGKILDICKRFPKKLKSESRNNILKIINPLLFAREQLSCCQS